MKNAAPKAIAVQQVIDDVMRRDRGRLLAGLIARLGDFSLAEDALQEASISALKHWGRVGVPDNPVAWLMKAGLNKGIDHIRKSQRAEDREQRLGILTDHSAVGPAPDTFSDDRLRLIFTCCHPALEQKSRVALTLRSICQLTTREVAAAFLDSESAMGQRISRAKAQIKSKGIAYQVPEADGWPARLSTVLATLYLIFTTGYVNEDDSQRDLCQEGIFLARLLRQLQPGDPEIEGTLALFLLTESRRSARIGADGAQVPVGAQDPTLWRADMITEAQQLLQDAMARGTPGPFQMKAAIADCHMMRPGPDWAQMALLYQTLWRYEPTPVVALNWAVTLAESGAPEWALEKVEGLQGDLSEFQPFHAACGRILAQLGRFDEARAAYQQAIAGAPHRAARLFLEAAVRDLPG